MISLENINVEILEYYCGIKNINHLKFDELVHFLSILNKATSDNQRGKDNLSKITNTFRNEFEKRIKTEAPEESWTKGLEVNINGDKADFSHE